MPNILPSLRTHRPLFHIFVPVILSIVLFFFAIFLFFIPSLEEALLSSKREEAKELVNTVRSFLDGLERDRLAGRFSLEEAQRAAIDYVREIRYGPEKKDYFWLHDNYPRMIMHPFLPALEGTSIREFEDPDGKRMFAEAVEIVKSDGAGYLSYIWQWKDNPDILAEKISYVSGFEPWGWIVGTGLYIDDVQAEIQSVTTGLQHSLFVILIIIAALLTYITRRSYSIDGARKNAEDRIRRSEERYRRIFENMQDVYFEIDFEGTILEVSPSISEISQYGRFEVIGKSIYDIYLYPEKRSELLEKLDAESFVQDYEIVLKDKDGSPVTCSINSHILAGSIYGKPIICGSLRDITKRKEVENRLVESESDLRRAQSVARIGSWKYVVDEGIFHASEEAKKIFNFEYDETEISYERVFNERIHPDDRRLEEKNFRKMLNESYFMDDTYRIVVGDEIRWIHSIGNLVKRAKNESDIVIGTVQDITEKKALEEKLEYSNRMSAIGELSRKITHEIGNPLSSILHASEELYESLELEPSEKRLMQIILEETDRLYGIINEFLKFSKMKEPEFLECDLLELVTEVLILLKENPGFVEKKILVTTQFEDEIPAVSVDTGMIKEVIWNLLLNAGDAVGEEGKIDIAIFAEGGNEGGLIIRISDNGTGIPAEKLKSIFDPYFTTKKSGSGLGLAIVKKIINDHNGDITVSTEVNSGTEFTIRLPISREE